MRGAKPPEKLRERTHFHCLNHSYQRTDVIMKPFCGVSGQTAQPVPLAQLKLSMAVYRQKLNGRPPDEQPKQLTPLSFGRDVKLGVPCLDAACIVGLN